MPWRAVGKEALLRLPVDVTPVNDPPFFRFVRPGGAFVETREARTWVGMEAVEDTPLVWMTPPAAPSIQVLDVDNGDGLLTLRVASAPTFGGPFFQDQPSQQGVRLLRTNATSEAILQGSLPRINTVLAGLRWRLPPDFNGLATLHFSVLDSVAGHASDEAARSPLVVTPLGDAIESGSMGLKGLVLSAEATVTVHVAAVNDAPTWGKPPASELVVREDTPTRLPPSEVADVDVQEHPSGDGTLTVRMSASAGLLSLPQPRFAVVLEETTWQPRIHAPVSTLSDEDGRFTFASNLHVPQPRGSNLTFRGTLQDINAALQMVVYTPDLDSTLSDIVMIQVEDEGHCGPGCADDRDASGMVSASIAVHVDEVNDPPHLSVPRVIQVIEGVAQPLYQASGIRVDDVDCGDCTLTVRVVTAAGDLALQTHEEVRVWDAAAAAAATVQEGNLLKEGAGGLLRSSASPASTLVFEGLVRDVNRALREATYVPDRKSVV